MGLYRDCDRVMKRVTRSLDYGSFRVSLSIRLLLLFCVS